jgi:hypothetical protein
MKSRSSLAWALSALTISPVVTAQPRAFEVAPDQADQLPQGKEADGIIGDFVMLNDHVVATVSQNAPDRRANMSTFYGADGITPGCLYDLTPAEGQNDQLTIFAPCAQKGPVSWVRIVKDGNDGQAVVETVVTAAGNGGLFKRHTYTLADGWQGILVSSTFKNESPRVITFPGTDRWTNFQKFGRAGRYHWADAVDPADKIGYAITDVPDEISLQPGEERTIERFVAVGRSPVDAIGVLARRDSNPPEITFELRDEAGKPLTTARVLVPVPGASEPLSAYPNADGRVRITLPPGSHEFTVTDAGRATLKRTVQLKPGDRIAESVAMGPQSAIEFDITSGGASIPCKANFAVLGDDGQPVPDEMAKKALDLGPPNRAHGCVDQWHSESGRFRVPMPPGKYRVVVTRGIEYSHLRNDVDIRPGETARFSGSLDRLIDTRGWVSADFHNHSTPSGDNTCGTDDRIINLAAEHIEFAPATEHNRLYDWAPHIKRLGLDAHLSTVPGIELTGSTEHLNSFPFTPEPRKQDNGAPKWNADPRISAITLRNWQRTEPDRWVQVNHPNLEQCFVDSNKDGVVDHGYVGVGQFVDAWEIENYLDTGPLATAPYRIDMVGTSSLVKRVRYVREFIWLQLLNQGLRLRCVAVADAHSVHGNGVGGWRMFLPSSTDEPSKIDWREMTRAARTGNSYVTTGPFLEVSAAAGSRRVPAGGDITAPNGALALRVRVQCTDWIDIDRIQIVVKGRQPPEYNFTRKSHPDWFGSGAVKFEREIPLKLAADAHLIVIAIGENHDLKTCFGSSPQSKLKPIAYNNPIYADIDENGWQPNKDTLGFDLPVANLTVERVTELLGPQAPGSGN